MKLIYCLLILVPIVIGAHIKINQITRGFETSILSETDDIKRLQHTFGRNEQGQYLVGFESKVFEYPTENNVVLTVDFPQDKKKNLTAIIIYVNQTSSSGKAFLIDGGWSRDFVKFYVEANGTTLFDYDYKIYAKDANNTEKSNLI